MIKSSFHNRATADEVVANLSLSALTVVVTGGATGIGLETCLSLAKAGAEIVLGVRNKDLAEKAIEEIKARALAKSAITWLKLDLADLESVKQFATNWNGRPLNVLINNAGVMACPQTYTKDGFEMHMGTNHFGHFLLTLLLVPALQAGAKRLGRPSRVVNVSSSGHRSSPIRFEDIHFKATPYNKWQAYGQSKTANALFAREFDNRFKNSGIRAFSLHPGGIWTPLQRYLPREEMIANGWMDENGKTIALDGMKTLQQGASTSVWAAVSPDLEGFGGMYLEDNSCAEPFQNTGSLFAPGYAPHIVNDDDAEHLWLVSEKAVGAYRL